MTTSSYPRLRLHTRWSNYLQFVWRGLAGVRGRGDQVERLERALEAATGARHAIAMPMARTAIYFAVRSLIRPGQKVILSPYTIVDVVNMVICAGGVPVFADLKVGSCNLDPDEVERLADDETGAVLVTHFYGEACDIERIAAFCRRRGIPLIEDAAQAFGVTVGGKPVGTWGDIGILSFGLYKNVTSFYGGASITNRADVANNVRRDIEALPPETMGKLLPKVAKGLVTDIVTWPPVFRSFTFWLFRWAYLKDVRAITHQFKIDTDPQIKRTMPEDYLRRLRPLQASLILPQLAHVGAAQSARVRNAQRYYDGLKDIAGLTLPPPKFDGSHGYYYYCILYPEREKLVRYAQTHGRDIQESYHRNCANLSCFGNYQRVCPNAEKVSESVIYLPAYADYPASEIDRTVVVIRDFFAGRDR